MLNTEFEIDIEDTLVHERKALGPIAVTESGITIEVRLVQLAKPLTVVTESGITIEARLVQLPKPLRVMTESGITTRVRRGQS